VLVLASASPRRRQLLAWLGVDFALATPDVDERVEAGESATALVARLARSKAAAVAVLRLHDWVLAADTVVEIDGALLGKPADAADAVAMLERLAGREHRVVTGFALLRPGGGVQTEDQVTTRVHFRSVALSVLTAYVASGEPMDKAGAYAVQGRGAGLIERVEGSFTNVIGLPLDAVGCALAEAGLLAV
jgi:septum formation protein